jgi:hypothetical protein
VLMRKIRSICTLEYFTKRVRAGLYFLLYLSMTHSLLFFFTTFHACLTLPTYHSGVVLCRHARSRTSPHRGRSLEAHLERPAAVPARGFRPRVVARRPFNTAFRCGSGVSVCMHVIDWSIRVGDGCVIVCLLILQRTVVQSTHDGKH